MEPPYVITPLRIDGKSLLTGKMGPGRPGMSTDSLWIGRRSNARAGRARGVRRGADERVLPSEAD